MKIVTACDLKYYKYIPYLRRAAEAVGHPLEVYTFGPGTEGLEHHVKFPAGLRDRLNYGQPETLTWAPYKPFIIQLALGQGPVVWMDADAFPIKPLVPDFKEFDIGVTMRRPEERGKSSIPLYTAFLNAGVVFVNDTLGACDFVEDWRQEVSRCPRGDQEALNTLVLQVTDLTTYDKTFLRGDTRIHVFRTDEYNNYHVGLGEVPKEDTKVIHLKVNSKFSADYAEIFERYVT